MTRSRTSGSRFSRCDQANAATVATTRRAKTTAAKLGSRRGIVLADDTATGAPAETAVISGSIGRTASISSAVATLCAARPLFGLNMTTLSSVAESVLVTAPSSKPWRSTMSP